jgi:hypothetical protein
MNVPMISAASMERLTFYHGRAAGGYRFLSAGGCAATPSRSIMRRLTNV